MTLARSEPGKLRAERRAIGSPHHLDLLLFNSLAKINIVNVAYRSSLAAVNDCSAAKFAGVAGLTAVGRISRPASSSVGSASNNAIRRAGRADIAEQGVPASWSTTGSASPAPAKTPPSSMRSRRNGTGGVRGQSRFKKRMLDLAFEANYLDASRFGAEIDDDSERYGKVIRDAGITPQ